jgi:hypothetical protein
MTVQLELQTCAEVLFHYQLRMKINFALSAPSAVKKVRINNTYRENFPQKLCALCALRGEKSVNQQHKP